MQSLSLTVRLKLVKSLIRDRRNKIYEKTKVVCFLKYTKANWLAFTSANYYIKTSCYFKKPGTMQLYLDYQE